MLAVFMMLKGTQTKRATERNEVVSAARALIRPKRPEVGNRKQGSRIKTGL